MAQNHQKSKASLESENRYRLLFTQMHDGYALHEIICNDQGHPIDYRFLEVNPAFERMTGLKADFVLGHTVMEVWPKTDPSLIEKYGMVVQTGETIHFQKFNSQANRHFEVTAFRTAPNQFACSYNDITKRMQAKERLRESEEKYQALFDNIDNGIFIYDLETMIILDANSAMSAIYGYRYDELVGLNCLELSSEVEESIKATATADIDGRFKVQTRWHKMKDGTNFPIELDGYRIELKGKAVGCTVVKDITERKNIELDLLKAKSELGLKNKKLEESNVDLNALLKLQEKNKAELEQKSILLNESNIALKVLLKQREEDRDTLEKNVLFNVEKLLMPTLGKLKNNTSDNTQKAYLNILESNLNQIVSPFVSKVANHLLKLTPAQIQVANLIKQGMTTKEIAGLLNLSPATIAAQRQNIRKKLALAPQVSLRTVLASQ